MSRLPSVAIRLDSIPRNLNFDFFSVIKNVTPQFQNSVNGSIIGFLPALQLPNMPESPD